METKHTKGPWSAGTHHLPRQDGTWRSFQIKGPDGKSICAAASSTTRAGAELEANARLIAAAPNLLAVVLEAVDGCEAMGWSVGKKMREVIARARAGAA